MRILFCLLFLLPFSLSAKIQDSTAVSDSQEIIYDLDSQKKPLQFDEQKIEEYRSQDNFNYTEYKEVDNWWTQFKRWIGQILMKLLDWLGAGQVSGFWAVLFKLLPYIVVIGVLFLLGWLFMKVNPSDMLFEKQLPPQVALTDDEDIIQNQDIQELINQAIQNNNYRLAIRYYYLFVLKKMSDLEFINWESQKTNTDYIKELKDSSIKDQFKTITRLYDYIWYGSFEVNEKSYQQAEKEFQSITNRIQR